MKKILGIGNALVDRLATLSDEHLLTDLALPKGSMQLLDLDRYRQVTAAMAPLDCHLTTGGSAANTIKAIAALGGTAGLIGQVGHDEPGRFFDENFRQQGVTTLLREDETLPTGVASTFITPDGQRTFGTYLGAAAALRGEDLRPEWFEGYDFFYIEGYLVQSHDLIRRAVKLARAAGLAVCIDLASYNIVDAERNLFAELLPQADIVFANEQEAVAMTGLQDPRAALDALAAQSRVAVVKVGARGVWVKTGDSLIHSPAREVPHVVDTTAAGDYFSAGFLYNLARGGSLREAAELGSLLAGHIIEVVGTALSEETWREIKAGLADPGTLAGPEGSALTR